MAYLEFNYYSKALARRTVVNVILPEAGKWEEGVGKGEKSEYKTLYLFHGLTQNHTDWMRRSSIERYAEKYSIAVVMPNVERSWYCNTQYGANYFDFNLESGLELDGGEHDLYAIVRRNYEKGIEFPKMYIWCGTEDEPGLFKTNQRFHELLDELNIEHVYKESEGDHSWHWWDMHIQDGLRFLFEEN